MRCAEKFARILKPGDVIGLEGNLGSGKTVFVRGLAQGLGLLRPATVKSPTFVIMHIYPAKIPVYHFDLYRMEKVRDLEAIGFDDFLSDPGAVACIEWADRGADFFPVYSYRIRFDVVGERTRRIRFGFMKKKRSGGGP